MNAPIPAAKICIPPDDRRAILARIDEALASGSLTLGRYGSQLEARFAALIGAKFAVAVNSGTSALEIPLRAFGVAGREVIVPTNTFFATPAAALHAGARVRFADVDPATFALTVKTLEAALTKETAAVILVHIGGIVTPEAPEIRRFCERRGLFLLEDAAHAHGSSLGQVMAGRFGHVAAFSFYPTKVMTAGEGGIIVTDDKTLYEKALQFRDQGKEGFLTNFHVQLGYNWRMSELHAAVGLSQLERLSEFIAERQRIADEYTKRLSDLPGLKPVLPSPGSRSNFYKYIVLPERPLDRTALKLQLRERHQVSLSGEVYDTPCHRQPVFAAVPGGPFPGAEDVCRRHICLPIYPYMTNDEIGRVVSALAAEMPQGGRG